MVFALGYSNHENTAHAAEAAVNQVLSDCPSPALVFLFSTDEYEPTSLITSVARLTGQSRLVGACVPGIIVNGVLHRSGVGACALSGSFVCATHLERDIGPDPEKSGQASGLQLLESGVTEGTVFIFPDGFASNISEYLRGLYSVMGPAFTYVGGGTGDNLRFHRNYQYTECGVTNGGAALAVVQGVSFRTAVGHGWRPIGQPLMVTKASGKRVYDVVA